MAHRVSLYPQRPRLRSLCAAQRPAPCSSPQKSTDDNVNLLLRRKRVHPPQTNPANPGLISNSGGRCCCWGRFTVVWSCRGPFSLWLGAKHRQFPEARGDIWVEPCPVATDIKVCLPADVDQFLNTTVLLATATSSFINNFSLCHSLSFSE